MADSRTRNPRIDVLRGVAILVVLLLHFTLAYRLGDSPVTRIIPKPLLRALLINGNFGVTMFFTISGFLITAMSLERFGSLAAIRPRAFYGFRFARILPGLALAIALILILAALGGRSFLNNDPSARFMAVVVLSLFTFWHNVLMAAHGYFNYAVNIYWSLSVEEVFYLGFPLACVWLRRRRWLLALCALAVIAGPIYRHSHLDDDILYLYGYLACFDAIALGCGAALLAPRLSPHLAGRGGRLLQGAALLLVSATYLRGIHDHVTFSFTWLALGTGLLLMGSVAPGAGRWSSSRPLSWLRWLGRHSYELYLFHIIVLGWMRDRVRPGTLPWAAKPFWLLLFLVLSCLSAWFIARFFTEPVNAWLRARWRPPVPAGPDHSL